MLFNYAVVGATGNVGREILQILAERSVPSSEVIAIASAASKDLLGSLHNIEAHPSGDMTE